MVNTMAFGPASCPLCGRFLQQPGPRPLGHYLAGLPGYRGFLSWEQGGAVCLLPSCCLRSLSSPCPPCTDAYTETQRLPTQPVGHRELEPRPAAISPPCCWTLVCTLRPHLPQHTCLPPVLSLRPLSVTWTQALGYSRLLPIPTTRSRPPPYLEPGDSFECEAGVGTPGTPTLPLHQSWGGWDSPHPTSGLWITFHFWEKKEAGAQTVSAPGSQRPQGLVRGRSGEAVSSLL